MANEKPDYHVVLILSPRGDVQLLTLGHDEEIYFAPGAAEDWVRDNHLKYPVRTVFIICERKFILENEESSSIALVRRQ